LAYHTKVTDCREMQDRESKKKVKVVSNGLKMSTKQSVLSAAGGFPDTEDFYRRQ
jgi:hypothetical protein